MATEFVDKQWRIPNSWNIDESNQGKISNYSMKFNGTSDSVNVGLIKPFDNDVSNFAISYWIKADFLDSTKPFNGALIHLDFRYNGANRGVAIESSATSLIFYTAGGLGYNTTWSTPTSGLNNNEWNHIVINFDGSIVADADKAEFWINGSKKTSTVTNPGNNYIKAITGDGFLGNGFNSYPLEGKLDQFCTFDYTLSSSQIAILYGNNSAGYFQIGNPMALTPNPVVFYPLGDQDVQQTVDSTDWRIPNQVATTSSSYVFDFIPTQGINLGTNPFSFTENLSVSLWLKSTQTTTNTFIGKDVNVSGGRNWMVMLYQNKVYFWTTSTGNISNLNDIQSNVAGGVSDGQWHHIVCVNNYTDSTKQIYIDGVLDRTNNEGAAIFNSSSPVQIGKRSSGSPYDGEMSNVALWNTALTGPQVTTLYNNGAPGNISSLSPISWYKLNAADTFDGTNWTINDYAGSNDGTSNGMTSANLVSSNLPNAAAGYSPWAIDLDGIDDNFTIDNSLKYLNTENISISTWFFQDDSAAASSYPAIIINGFSGSGGSYWGLVMRPGNIVRAQLRLLDINGNLTFITEDITQTIVTGQWNHIAMTYDGTTLKGYINGVGETLSLSGASGQIQYSTTGMNSQDLLIGKRGTDNFYLDGKISNFAIWGSGLTSTQIATIYNNGIPGDISSLNPLAWWELGVMTGFNSGTWTAISNTKTNYAAVSTANMTEGDLVNGPGYSTNAIGTSTLVLEKQAPYSFNNALSENMAISNRDDSQASDSYPLIVELDLTGETSSYDFITPLLNAGVTFPFTMDWGDGTVETITSSSQFVQVGRLSHTYDTDTYPRPVIQIGKSTDVGQVIDFRVTNAGGRLQLSDLKQFGQATFKNFNLYNARNMLVTAKDNLKFDGNSLAGAFQFAFKANPTTINNWDISSVYTANVLFYQASEFNQDLNNWDTSSTRPGQSDPGILNLCSLTFTNNYRFNGDITNWFTTRSTSMSQMFSGCNVFNRDISTKYISAANSPTGSAYVAWDTQNITTLASAFFSARNFNQNISNWNTSKVTSMVTTFSGAFAFNQDISTKQVTINGVTYTAWDVSKVTNMFGMLKSTVFNNTFDNWELSANLTSVQQMFISNNTISDDNFSDNWAIFANSVRDDNSASGGAAPNFPSGVNATAQNNGAKIKVSRSAPTSSGGVQHFTTISRALSYLTSDVEIVEILDEDDALQLYTADFLDTATSSYPTKLVGVTVPDFTFEWSGSVWEFKKSGVTMDTDTGGATLQEGPENGTWNILTVVIANANWNFSNTGTVYTT